jgi:hypothetical protein
MKMFNKKEKEDRIGSTLTKSKTLDSLKEVERYFIKQMRKYGTESDYDVVANEIPYFKTLSYTEYATCFVINPLCQQLRVAQIRDAYLDECEPLDWTTYFANTVKDKKSNKYDAQKNKKDYETRYNLVVLAGSNKLKEAICLNKLKWVKDTHGEDVYFKAHPLTTHALIGELKDLFEEDTILPRNADLYHFLLEADVVYTSCISESAVYAVSLDKDIEPIDVYNKEEQGSFYHINKNLFTEKDPKDWVNKTFSSPKSGVINPNVDKDWKGKIDKYLEYIHQVREDNKYKYV